MRRRLALLLSTILSGKPLAYFIRDQFTTDLAAGAVNGTAAEPGPGTRGAVDTGNKLSISGAKIVLGGGSIGDPRFWYSSPTIVRAAGVALIAAVSVDANGLSYPLGFDTDQTGAPYDGFRFTAWNITQLVSGAAGPIVGAYAATTTYTLAIVLRSTGNFMLIKGGTYTEWTLLWVSSTNTNSPLYVALAAGSATTITADNVRCAPLPTPWINADYGIATQQLAGAVSEGATFAHEANCLIGWTVTARTDAQYMTFRRQDATNYWRVDTANDGSIALQEVVDGTPTSRGTGAAGSIANGQRMVVTADGSTIKVFANNALKITYASATNFATATAGKLLALGVGGAVSDIVSWPRTLSGSALSTLNLLNP